MNTESRRPLFRDKIATPPDLKRALGTDIAVDDRVGIESGRKVITMPRAQIDRRTMFRTLATGTLVGLDALFTAERTDAAAVGPNDNIKVTKVEAFVLKNSWVFVKVSTDAGMTWTKPAAFRAGEGTTWTDDGYWIAADPTFWPRGLPLLLLLRPPSRSRCCR